MLTSITKNIMLKINHNAGFFSCCTIKLSSIIDYFNSNKTLPKIVDSSEQFAQYKSNPGDITFNLFSHYENYPEIEFKEEVKIVCVNREHQFTDYSKLNFSQMQPFISKYFTPSESVLQTKKFLQFKYQIDYENTCAIFYRGNDKAKETNPPPYDEVIEKAKLLQNQTPNIKFLIQTDEKQFLDYALKNLANSFEIVELKKINQNRYSSIQYEVTQDKKLLALTLYFATIQIMSKCKNIIHTSGNGEMFTILYRGNVDGTIQYLNEKDYLYGVKNETYDPNKKEHWIIH